MKFDLVKDVLFFSGYAGICVWLGVYLLIKGVAFWGSFCLGFAAFLAIAGILAHLRDIYENTLKK